MSERERERERERESGEVDRQNTRQRKIEQRSEEV